MSKTVVVVINFPPVISRRGHVNEICDDNPMSMLIYQEREKSYLQKRPANV
jgi:hypothetical protein